MTRLTNISLALQNSEPDPVSALAQGIWYFIQALIGVPANLILIGLWSTSAELRKVPANIFILNMAVGDGLYLFSTGVFNLHWVLTRQLSVCKVGGFFTYCSALFSFCIPPYLAINRVIVIRRLNNLTHSWKEKLFSLTGAKLLCAGLWLYILCINIPFIYFDLYGRDVLGICGIVFDLPDTLFYIYYIGMVGFFFTSITLTILYYRKLSRWIDRMTKKVVSSETKSIVNETERLMKMTKYLSFMPIFCISPGVSYNLLLRFFPELVNVLVARTLMIPLNFPSLCNPFFTIFFMKPFRNALLDKLHMVKARWHSGYGTAQQQAVHRMDNNSIRVFPAKHTITVARANPFASVQNIL